MAVPWLRLLNGVLGIGDVVRMVQGRGGTNDLDRVETGPRGLGALETRLAGVLVAALKEAFDRDSQRLNLERDHLDAERERAQEALRLELRRQAVDREIGRLRLLAGVAVASWFGTLLFATRLTDGPTAARVCLGVGWALLLAALAAAFSAQTQLARVLRGDGDGSGRAAAFPSGAGAMAPWLIVAGLAAIGFGVLLL